MQETIHIKTQYSPYAAHGIVKEFPFRGEQYAIGLFNRPGHDAPAAMLIRKRYYGSEKIGPQNFRFFQWDCCVALDIDWDDYESILPDKVASEFEKIIDAWASGLEDPPHRSAASAEAKMEFVAFELEDIEIFGNRACRPGHLIYELARRCVHEISDSRFCGDPNVVGWIPVTRDQLEQLQSMAGLVPELEAEADLPADADLPPETP